MTFPLVASINGVGENEPALEEMQVYDSIVAAIGNTPLVRLNSTVSNLPCTVLVKIEYMNPGGSVKDRIGPAIIEDAERRGLLKPGGTIV